MRTTELIRFVVSIWRPSFYRITACLAVFLIVISLLAANANAAELKVMKTGLGSGTVTSTPLGINCGSDCDETYTTAAIVTLTATPSTGSKFVRWEGGPFGTTTTTTTATTVTVTVKMSADRLVRAIFDLATPIKKLTKLNPDSIKKYLTLNPEVNTPARFIEALPDIHKFKKNWILMTRSESLQTGTAKYPRILLPSENAQFVFSIGLAKHGSYPLSHPNAIEYMQWDVEQQNFRFHEIVVKKIDAERPRGISIDDSKCSKCHSTQNVLNRSSYGGTTGFPPGVPGGTPGELVKSKNKPNWDAYDSWGGMLPFNRDRIYQGSLEAAAFRKIMNLWTWETNDSARAVIELLELQPAKVGTKADELPAKDEITRIRGGKYDSHIEFAFDTSSPVLTEPAPTGTGTTYKTNYSFDGVKGSGTKTSVVRSGAFVTLHHSAGPRNDEGRGVQLFDLLGGLDGNFNQLRVVDELINHRFATGSVPIDVRPIALAIAISNVGGGTRLLTIDNSKDSVVSVGSPLNIDHAFFNTRNGMKINGVVADTEAKARSKGNTRRKADIQKINLDRTGDIYLNTGASADGLIKIYGGTTSSTTSTAMSRLRQEIFRRPLSEPLAVFSGDVSVMAESSTPAGGIYIDRESYGYNTDRVALYRYFLEPLGVSVDKWAMGVRGRSRTYTFADVLSNYRRVFEDSLKKSLLRDPGSSGFIDSNSNGAVDDNELIAAVNSTLSSTSLPKSDAVPKYTDVQRIFNKSCIECHGGLNYPPYSRIGGTLDLSENEKPKVAKLPINSRLKRAYDAAKFYAGSLLGQLYQFIIQTNEDCLPTVGTTGMMPCGGPALSKVDIETIRRWIKGGSQFSHGDPHLKTIDGTKYDFQAAGEFVLIRGIGIEVQARHTAVVTDRPLGPNAHTGLTSCVSMNSAVAVRVDTHRVTYQPNLNGVPDPSGMELRIDGNLVQMNQQGILLPSGGRIMPTIAPGGIQIEEGNGAIIVITPGWWNHYQLWYLHIDTRNVRATEGLLGAVAPGNWLPALPDGSLLGPKPVDLNQRYHDLYEVFGNAWRVDDTTTLFDYAAGTSTETFSTPDWPYGESPGACILPPGQGPGIPPLEPLPFEVAEQLCNEIVNEDRKDNCIQDVMVTGEPGLAATYILSDEIERNLAPTAPVLVFPKDGMRDIDAPINFTWNNATDADNDLLAYNLHVWQVGQMPNSGVTLPYGVSSVGLISKTVSLTNFEREPGQAFYWKVTVEDGKGATVESETWRFEIK